MICAIYKSKRKPQTFLYLPADADVNALPAALLAQFGQPELLLKLALGPQKKLAQVSVERVLQAISEQGFYLQLPPPEPNLLEQHKQFLSALRDQ